ncbi:hypothetical protein [Streptomyces sp. NPDC048603]|uniref:hypothetical protein n=1 Tax=Streptomyces sp. NPDC048603 TaxID=3365577 RepID=UPI003719B442
MGTFLKRKQLLLPALLAAAVALTGCSGKAQPAAGDSPPPTTAEIKYYDCLKEQGLTLEYTDNGAPRLAKTDPLDKMSAAEKTCEPLLPPAEPISAGQLAEEKRWVECLRRQGLTWAPDPDPSTGVVPMTPEQTAELKTKRTDALENCRSPEAKKHDNTK